MELKNLLQDIKNPLSSIILNDEGIKTKKSYTINLLGLGDVGSTLLIALKLLGQNLISEIGIYDINDERLKRWEMELNQIIDPNLSDFPNIKIISKEELFDADVFVFTASKFVPSVGSEVKDVRMAQLESNSKLISIYAKMANESHFKGLFAVVSDPVDLLCSVVQKNTPNLSPYQIRGYGLGVMYARAKYYANKNNINFDKARAYGPHGKDLIIANDISNYDEHISKKLTELTINANMEVRDLGFKPFVAPAISSGAISIINTLKGNWHYSCVYIDDCYLGIRNRYLDGKTEVESIPAHPQLIEKIEYATQQMKSILHDL